MGGMQDAKKCTRKEALDKLVNGGAFVFITIKNPVYSERLECSYCDLPRSGNYCNECGEELEMNSYISNYNKKKFRLSYSGNTLRTEIRNEKGFYDDTDEVFTLEMFLSDNNQYSWIW